VSDVEQEKFDYVCPLDKLGREAPEGSPVGMCEFVSRGWATQEEADARGALHGEEHRTGEPMPELYEHEAALAAGTEG
jgi:hypothetical protein